MKDYSNICYTKNFINQMIVRIDYHQFLSTSNVFHPDIEKVIIQDYPHRAPDQIIRFNAINVVIDPNQGIPNANSQSVDGIQREYRSKNARNKVFLANKYIVFEVNEYKSFDEHMQVMRDILAAFFLINKVTAVRIGIRYINIFDSQKLKIQKNYFSPEISAAIHSPGKGNDSNATLLRSMHLSEYLVDSMKLNFRYGMYNPNYPNPLSRNDFALDYDCFSEEPTDSFDEILQRISNGHQAIQYLFESAISNSLRKVMSSE